jgi:hypothetical protein
VGIISRTIRPKAAVALGIAGVLALGAVLAARSPDPFVADPAAAAALRSALASQQVQAQNQLERLRDELTAALDQGRRGAALTVNGSERPGSHLSAAARGMTDADPLVGPALATLRQLAGSLAVSGSTNPPPALALVPGRLSEIGGQLDTSAGAADVFWSMRRATEGTLGHLQDAFAAVDAKQPARALLAIAAAQVSLDQVRAWPGTLQTLPIWTEATGDLLAALKRLAIALRDRDLAAAKAADRAYRAAAATAHRADLALAIAIAEGGSDVSGNSLAAAANALRAVEDSLGKVRSILA